LGKPRINCEFSHALIKCFYFCWSRNETSNHLRFHLEMA
jgi:hypothetical protein